ncbi:Ty3/Gypsy polyprotein/retrotransposon [Rhizoctonia solani]|uniref:Ty3/Gypsy polyprotein/retrotransposon n=1 Tax=Rhizoctonia solani TaxID=456999 RepID=A0A8H8SUL5_9AGAM|nr:Ty3/Gypsy polyprotein/retrotransposon [Rhizoctonia solani]QRW17517.1 Ty3/Gypsy polyprotein/retrotransposon [Rhizoctonia solani]
MKAHNALLDARVKMTKHANEHWRPAEYKVDDLVYISTKNIQWPKGTSKKLLVKYIGPYKIAKVVTKGASYEVELGKDLQARGIHPVFHALLLRPHKPVDDRRFPGRNLNQVTSIGESPQEWAVDRITSHKGKGRNAIFELVWKTGDRTWEPYQNIKHLEALETYREAQGVPNAGKLPIGKSEETKSNTEKETKKIQLNTIAYIKDPQAKAINTTPHSEPCTYTLPMSSNAIQMTAETLQAVLNAQANVQIESNKTLLQLARETGQRLKNISMGYSRRQRKAFRKNNPHQDPKHIGRRRKQKDRQAQNTPKASHPVATTSQSANLPMENIIGAMANLGFDNYLTATPTELQNIPLAPPVPAYTPAPIQGAPDSLPKEPQATHIIRPNPPLTLPQTAGTNNNQPAQEPVTIAVNPAPTRNPSNQANEETIDYKDDYTMDETQYNQTGHAGEPLHGPEG